ncbi:MAG: hypothetical protein AB1832_19070 [Pseudomonadota bacterium]|jgi:hypothetical protein
MHIELLKPHAHAGQPHAAGERLDLNEASARWLIAQGAAKAVASTTTPDPKPHRREAASGTTQGD